MVGRPKFSGGPARALEAGEVRKLISVVSNSGMNRHRNTMIIKTLLYSAGRISEVLNMRVNDVWDGQNVLNSFVFRKTKNKTTRRIPINSSFKSDLKTYILESGLTDSDPLFPSARTSDGLSFINPNAGSLLVKRLMKNAGINDASAHSTRKFALMTMLRNQVNLQTLRQISGHKSLASLQHYLASSSDEVSSAIEKIRF